MSTLCKNKCKHNTRVAFGADLMTGHDARSLG